jgi:hypothetical protein
LFGEENEEKEIKAQIEYRVAGSNGTFVKEISPIKIKINSSPLVVRIDSVDKVSSGQEFDVKITVQSNASTIQKNVLISASYPSSFSFVKSSPEPSYGQNEWLIAEIKPESAQTITLRGKVNGQAGEVSEIQFSAGSPKSENQFAMGSVMSKAKTSYTIEHPFLDIEVAVNQDSDGEAILRNDSEAKVIIKVKNTLAETIYDMRLEVIPKGNLIRDDKMKINTGVYDSTTKAIRWEVAGMRSLAEVAPGEIREFEFSVSPDLNQIASSFDISTNVFAKRIGEGRASEELVGTDVAKVKYSSAISLGSQVGYSDGLFSDTGPVPPVADEKTTYTITFVAEAGANDVSNVVLTTTFPQYIKWLDNYSQEGEVVYNPVASQLKWNVGTMSAKSKKQLQVQVSLLPSVTQVGKTLIIVGTQELKAVDRFTGVNLQALHQILTNELSPEAGYSENSGVVQTKQ